VSLGSCGSTRDSGFESSYVLAADSDPFVGGRQQRSEVHPSRQITLEAQNHSSELGEIGHG